MSLKTVLAISELAQAAAHMIGVTGPVQFTICRPPSDADLEQMADQYIDDDDDRWDDDDGWCGDCGDCEDCWDNQMSDCGMMADGFCSKAGSEYCDWDCRMSEILEEL